MDGERSLRGHMQKNQPNIHIIGKKIAQNGYEFYK